MYKKRSRGALLFISVLLHGLLVLLPWQEPQQERPRPVAAPQPPANTISVVDASQLPTRSEPQLAPPEPAVPPAPPLDSPAVLPETPIPETSDSPSNESATEATSNTIPEATLPSTLNPVIPANGEQIAAEWEYLVGYLKGQGEGFEGMPLADIFNFFGEPVQVNQFNSFFKDANDDSEIHVFDFNHFPTQTPDQVLQIVERELESSTGFDLQPESNFSAGEAYQLLQGEMLRYLIIVKLRDGEGSVLILSESLPGIES